MEDWDSECVDVKSLTTSQPWTHDISIGEEQASKSHEQLISVLNDEPLDEMNSLTLDQPYSEDGGPQFF
jgi:hypothetical protein